jgi:prepilin-type N-terminal cleavage/methylation domain-containing protein
MAKSTAASLRRGVQHSPSSSDKPGKDPFTQAVGHVSLRAGFTLIELLVVILIIAISAAVAIPIFIRQREKGYESQVRSALRDAATGCQLEQIRFRSNVPLLERADSLD